MSNNKLLTELQGKRMLMRKWFIAYYETEIKKKIRHNHNLALLDLRGTLE